MRVLLFAVALALGLSGSIAHAATLAVFTHDYGSGVGKVDPGGNDVLGTDHVKVKDSSTSRFFDSFDLSGVTGTITSFELTLTFKNAGPSCFIVFCNEVWSVRTQGSNSSASNDDWFSVIDDQLSPQTFVIDASTDTGSIDVFAHSVATQDFAFWFSEFTLNNDGFRLDQAEFKVLGEPAPVPLPAGLPLMLLGLGSLAFLRRRA